MKRFRWLVALWPAALLAFAPPALAQQANNPHIGYVFPAGGRQGDTFQVKVGGQFLDGVSGVYLSGAGVQARILEHTKPMTQREFNSLREKVRELQQKAKDPAVLNEIAEIRKKMAAFSRNANPVISEQVTLQVTMAAEAEPGQRQLRLATPLGVSNPLAFCVGLLPEVSEREIKGGPAQSETSVTLPATVNGRIVPGSTERYRLQVRQFQQYLPGDMDRYRFSARKGQHLVVSASARELIPYLADAVPGWFQAVVALYDSRGKEVAYDDDYRFHPDPVLHYQIPGDGDYVVEIRDAIYRGRDDFVYRISLGELPFITGIFPLGGPSGAQAAVQVRGWNLPLDRVTMDTLNLAPGVYPLSVKNGELQSNQVPFAVDTLRERLESEPNNLLKRAQKVQLPVIVNGRIDAPGDQDFFAFKGRGGEEVVAEVLARRLDSPLDSVLKLLDARGSQLAFNDDHEDKGAGLDTHHADSLLSCKLPADGTYYLQVGDAQRKGGSEHAYRLRISQPRPDFELRVVPSSINAGPGATVPITVYALRKDGFSEDIALALKGAPRGYILSGAVVPARQDQVRLTLTVPQTPPAEPFFLSMEGRSRIQGREVVRTAMPADDMMQAFAYRHLVPATEWRVALAKRGGQPAARILGEQSVRIPAGGAVRVRIGMPATRFFEKVQVELSEPPEGISVREVSPAQQGMEFVLQCDAAKAKPGLRGNLIVTITGERTPQSGNKPPLAARRRLPMGTLPAIPFEVIAP